MGVFNGLDLMVSLSNHGQHRLQQPASLLETINFSAFNRSIEGKLISREHSRRTAPPLSISRSQPNQETRKAVSQSRPEFQLRMAFRSSHPVDVEDHDPEEDGNKDNMHNSKRAF